MADHAPESVRLHRRHFPQQILNERPADGHEGVAVVETERRELVALAARQSVSPQPFRAFARYGFVSFANMLRVCATWSATEF